MEWSDGEKTKNYELGEKNEKGERKKEENYIQKRGEKALKMHRFGLYSQQVLQTCSARRLSANAARSSLVKNLGLAAASSSAFFLANNSSKNSSYDSVFPGPESFKAFILKLSRGIYCAIRSSPPPLLILNFSLGAKRCIFKALSPVFYVIFLSFSPPFHVFPLILFFKFFSPAAIPPSSLL